jgi:plastocyanin
VAAALLAGCAANGGGQDGSTSDPPVKGVTTVVAKQIKFSPAAIEVPAGAEVTWSLEDGPVPYDVKGDGWAPVSRNGRGPSAAPSTNPAPTTTPARCTRR